MTMSRTLARRMMTGIALSLPLLLAACGGSDEPTSQAGGGLSDASSETAVEGDGAPELSNPVDILKKIDGCQIPEGTEFGDTDIDGYLYANCEFLDNAGTGGTSITVRTYPGDPNDVATPDQLSGDDSHKKIVGSDFILTITGDWSAYSKNVDPEAIAAQVGGEFVSPK